MSHFHLYMYSWDGEYTDCWPYAQAMEGIMETLIFVNHPAGEYYAALTKILPISIGGRYIDPERGWTEMLRLEKNHNPYAEQYVSRGYCPPELRKDIAK